MAKSKKGKADETLKRNGNKPPEKKPASDTNKKYERKWGNQFSLKYTSEEIEKLADEMVEYFTTNENAIYFTSFAIHKMISRQRFYEFAKSNEYFAFCFNHVKDIIVNRFVLRGMDAKNAGFQIFGLKNIASDEFKDKQEVEHSGGVKIIRDTIKDKLKQKENG
jgi:hypothetical protein